MKKCPYCAELIQDEAIICRFCQRDLRYAYPPNQQMPPQNYSPMPPAKQKKNSNQLLGKIIITIVFLSICYIAFQFGANKQPSSLPGTTPQNKATNPSPIAPSVTSTTTKISSLIVPSGELAKYMSSYKQYDKVFVKKKNGTTDERPNDLEELVKDWAFYRNKILEYSAAGNSSKATEARASFNQTNAWLSEYDNNDVDAMFLIVQITK